MLILHSSGNPPFSHRTAESTVHALRRRPSRILKECPPAFLGRERSRDSLPGSVGALLHYAECKRPYIHYVSRAGSGDGDQELLAGAHGLPGLAARVHRPAPRYESRHPSALGGAAGLRAGGRRPPAWAAVQLVFRAWRDFQVVRRVRSDTFDSF